MCFCYKHPPWLLACTCRGPNALIDRLPPLLWHSQGAGGQAQQQQGEMETDVWASKPAWCQPWTILGTGSAFVAIVWAISGGSTGWTVAGSLPVLAWWYLFLGIMPGQYRGHAESVNVQQRQLLELQRRQRAE